MYNMGNISSPNNQLKQKDAPGDVGIPGIQTALTQTINLTKVKGAYSILKKTCAMFTKKVQLDQTLPHRRIWNPFHGSSQRRFWISIIHL